MNPSPPTSDAARTVAADDTARGPTAAALATRDLRRHLRAWLRTRVADDATADDLVQEVFLRALTATTTPTDPAAWLHAIARHTLVDHYRARRPPAALAELPDEPPAAAADDDARAHRELSSCLRPFAEDLPPIYRDALVATDFEGRPMREQARAAGVSLSAIKSRAARARQLLKARVLACCRVEVTPAGQVTDYHPHARCPARDPHGPGGDAC